jgi:D-alanyl-D-alanine carboxypeptidase
MFTCLSANAVTVYAYNITKQHPIVDSEIDTIRPIASITKLMTVMAVLDIGQNMKEKIGKYTREQLIQLALVKSDNNAAKTLCDKFPGGNFACIKYMNEKANYLGMYRTRFVEPTGLSPMNISTALGLVRLVNEASHYPEIVKASRTSTLTVRNSKKKSTTVRNTNPMISKYSFLVSKTGTTNAAGHCIVMMINTEVGRRIVIVLGSKPGKRIFDAEKIALNA